MRLSIAKNIIQASVEANLKLSGNTSEYTTPMLWVVHRLRR
jgi:hypothetical protein